MSTKNLLGVDEKFFTVAPGIRVALKPTDCLEPLRLPFHLSSHWLEEHGWREGVDWECHDGIDAMFFLARRVWLTLR